MPAQVFGAAAAIATAAVIVTSVFVESAGSVAGENPVVTLVPFSVMFDAGQAPASMTGTVWGEPLPIWSSNPARGTSTRSGFELMGYSTFDGVTIPSYGRAGWFHGTGRWNEGEFFRAEITDYQLGRVTSR